jgi:hypothetical protein
MSMENSDDTIGNRTRDLLVCSAVPKATAPNKDQNKYQTMRYELNLANF